MQRLRDRRRVLRGAPGALLSGALLAFGCASTSGSQGVWVKTEGAAATAEEVSTARSACARRLRAGPQSRPHRLSHHEWGRNMLRCMQESGFEFVEDTPDS